MSSIVAICNRGLQKLGADHIMSLDENTKEARECKLAFEPTRDSELRAHAWNFAVKRMAIPASGTAPAFGYSYAYPLPSDCLRLLKNDHREEVYPRAWKLESRAILTNESGPLLIRYIARITDPSVYDATFVEALSCKLAMELCEALTQSNTKRQLAAEEYKAAIREARRVNAFENQPAEQDTDPWITARL